MIKKSLTLIELLIVLIVVGITAGFVVPNLARARLNAIDREAQAMLVLIRAAQQARVAEGRDYSCCQTHACFNAPFDDGNECGGPDAAGDGLGLDMPPDVAGGGNWNYSIQAPSGDGVNNAFCAEATGGASGNTYSIRQNQWRAVLGGCP